MSAFFAVTVSLTASVVVVVPSEEFDRWVVVRGSSDSVVVGLTDQVGDPADGFPTGQVFSLILPANEELYAYGPNSSTVSLFVGGSPG